jgi:tRNA threonylcarbamoyladenosine biosynthesis protein TsaB
VPAARGLTCCEVPADYSVNACPNPLEWPHFDGISCPPDTRRVCGADAVALAILKILALETSTEWCSAALSLDGRVLAGEEHAGQRHSELLLPMIDALLKDAGIALADCEAIAFGMGPGSFTGLRIACGVAQGLGFAVGLPLVGVGTLLAVAQASAAERVIVCLDARMGGVYSAAYERSAGAWLVVNAPSLCAPAEAPQVDGEGWTGAGGGFAAYGPALLERYGNRLDVVRPELRPHAKDIASLGADMVAAGLAVPAEQAHPIYLRDRVALTVDERQAIKSARSAGIAAADR